MSYVANTRPIGFKFRPTDLTACANVLNEGQGQSHLFATRKMNYPFEEIAEHEIDRNTEHQMKLLY